MSKTRKYYIVRFFIPTAKVKVEGRNMKEVLKEAFKGLFYESRRIRDEIKFYREDVCELICREHFRDVNFDECYKLCRKIGLDYLHREYPDYKFPEDDIPDPAPPTELEETIFGWVITDGDPGICEDIDVEVIAVEEDEQGNRKEKLKRRTKKLRELAREICEEVLGSTIYSHLIEKLQVQLTNTTQQKNS